MDRPVTVFGIAPHGNGATNGPEQLNQCLVPMLQASKANWQGGEIFRLPKPSGNPFDELQELDGLVGPKLREAIHDGRIPIIVGGDHSIEAMTIPAAVEVYGSEEIAVVAFDDHLDAVTWPLVSEVPTPGPRQSGHPHGMYLAAVLRRLTKVEGTPERLILGNPSARVLPKNVAIFGADCVDPSEVRLAEECGITLVTGTQLRWYRHQIVYDTICKLISRGAKKFWITLDVDGTLLRATGLPNVGGITPGDLFDYGMILSHVIREKGCEVVGITVAEYYPEKDRHIEHGGHTYFEDGTTLAAFVAACLRAKLSYHELYMATHASP